MSTAAFPIAPNGRSPDPDGSRGSQATGFSQNASAFHTLTSIILEQNGRHSRDNQLRAYVELHELAATGRLHGMKAEDAERYSTAVNDSTIAQLKQDLYSRAVAAAEAAYHDSGCIALVRSQIDALAAMSEFEQQVHFEINVNAPNYQGVRPYRDLSEYRAVLDAHCKLSGILSTFAPSSGDFSAPLYAAAARIANSRAMKPKAFIASVARLLAATLPVPPFMDVVLEFPHRRFAAPSETA